MPSSACGIIKYEVIYVGNDIAKLQTILLFSQYAVRDINQEFKDIGTSIRLTYPTETNAITITLNNSICVSHSFIELDDHGKTIVDKAFRNYGLIPIFYKGSIGVEVDND